MNWKSHKAVAKIGIRRKRMTKRQFAKQVRTTRRQSKERAKSLPLYRVAILIGLSIFPLSPINQWNGVVYVPPCKVNTNKW